MKFIIYTYIYIYEYEYENMILQITNLQSRVPTAATLVICVFHDPILGRATGKQLFALELVFEEKKLQVNDHCPRFYSC